MITKMNTAHLKSFHTNPFQVKGFFGVARGASRSRRWLGVSLSMTTGRSGSVAPADGGGPTFSWGRSAGAPSPASSFGSSGSSFCAIRCPPERRLAEVGEARHPHAALFVTPGHAVAV